MATISSHLCLCRRPLTCSPAWAPPHFQSTLHTEAGVNFLRVGTDFCGYWSELLKGPPGGSGLIKSPRDLQTQTLPVQLTRDLAPPVPWLPSATQGLCTCRSWRGPVCGDPKHLVLWPSHGWHQKPLCHCPGRGTSPRDRECPPGWTPRCQSPPRRDTEFNCWVLGKAASWSLISDLLGCFPPQTVRDSLRGQVTPGGWAAGHSPGQ